MADDAPSVPREQRAMTTQEMLKERGGPTLATTALRTLIGLLIFAVIATGLFFAASAVDPKKDQKATAPWSHRGAPDVKPATLVDQ